MSDLACAAPPFPAPVVDAVKEAVATTFGSICGDAPAPHEGDGPGAPADCVVGVISFVGDVTWTLALVLPEPTAASLVVKFAGFEIPFDSPDMGDVVAELANVLAGDVRARLEGKKLKTQMSLPTMTRGKGLELLTVHRQTAARLAFGCSAGDFWCGLTAAQPGQAPTRMPGT
jgi:CheY-specific phosphatase CheX